MAQRKIASSLSTPTSRSASPTIKAAKRASLVQHKKSGTSTPTRAVAVVDQGYLDVSGLNLGTREGEPSRGTETPPAMTFAKEKLLEEARRSFQVQEESGQLGINLVVIGKATFERIINVVTLIPRKGHVDAGKSTLMGRLLYELGRVDEKTRIANERGSSKVGKASFSWAWELDGTQEERER